MFGRFFYMRRVVVVVVSILYILLEFSHCLFQINKKKKIFERATHNSIDLWAILHWRHIRYPLGFVFYIYIIMRGAEEPDERRASEHCYVLRGRYGGWSFYILFRHWVLFVRGRRIVLVYAMWSSLYGHELQTLSSSALRLFNICRFKKIDRKK